MPAQRKPAEGEAVFILGATATGKTRLAVTLAKRINGEIVSADSRQVYRGLDIGTGKDLPLKTKIRNSDIEFAYGRRIYKLFAYNLDSVPVWMYDVVDPADEFSVAVYRHLAKCVIQNIWKRRKLPIVVGGAGLYIRSLLKPMETVGIPRDKSYRSLTASWDTVRIRRYVRTTYPEVWQTLNRSERYNRRRLIRRAEIAAFRQAGNSQSRSGQKADSIITGALIIGLRLPNSLLYLRIDERVEKRISEGSVSEVRRLLDAGIPWDSQALNSLGYRQWRGYFSQPVNRTLDNPDSPLFCEAITRWKFAEHAYARRQNTWFKKEPGIIWFDADKPDFAERVNDAVLAWYTDRRQYGLKD